MAPPKVIEGTGEELERYLKAAPKRRFRLIPLPTEDNEERSAQNERTVAPNEKGLAIMQEIAERHKGRRTTDNSNTKRLLREARAGAAYGYEPGSE